MGRFTSLRPLALIILALSFASVSIGAVGSAPPSIGLDQAKSIRVESETPSGATLSFKLDDLNCESIEAEGETFDRFYIPGDPATGKVGWPEMPTVVRYVLIPAQSGVELDLKTLKHHYIENVNPFPKQPAVLESNDAVASNRLFDDTKPLIRNTEALTASGFWPETAAEIGRPAIMRGFRMVPVIIHPVRYDAAARRVEVIDQIDLSLNYSTDANRVNVVTDLRPRQSSPAFYKLLDKLVINPPAADPGRDFGVMGGSLLYVIGPAGNTWNPAMAELTPLVEWRRMMGWTVNVLRVQNPGDKNSVKREIQDFYDNAEIKPEAIILCGDADNAGGNQFVMDYFNKQDGAAYPYESDHPYTQLEGDDLLPEASVGRLIFNSANRLHGLIAKTIKYEKHPYVGAGNNIGWQKRGAVESTKWSSGLSTNDATRWARDIMLMNGYESVDELYCSAQVPDAANNQFVRDNFTAGISLFVHRGYLWMNPSFGFGEVANLRNGEMLPLALILTCNTGDYAEHISDGGADYFNESFSWAPNGGAIGAVGFAGATHTAYNNVYLGGVIEGLFNQEIYDQGWAHTAGKLALYTHYANRGDINHEENRNMEAWLTEFYIGNLMGDPAVDLFTNSPRELSVDAPDLIRHGETHVEVTVLHNDDQSAATDATVCLYKAETCQIVKTPDAEGHVSFDLDPAWSQQGSFVLTVSGHNLLTSFDSLATGQAQNFIGAGTFTLDDDNAGASVGNSDGAANQTETLEIGLNITNFGATVPDGGIDVSIEPEEAGLQVEVGNAHFDACPAAGQSVTADLVVTILGGFPSKENATFHVTCTNGQATWNSSLSIPVVGPKYEVASVAYEGDPLRRAENAQLFITLKNVGNGDGGAVFGTLHGLTRFIGAAAQEVSFPAIAQNRTGRSESTFPVSAHPFFFGGNSAPMELSLETAGGFHQTVPLDLTLAPAVSGEPFGPDKYGYICFDKNDTNWYACPTYDWIEIDSTVMIDSVNRGPGHKLPNMNDRADQEDKNAVIELPFAFQYYGEEFRTATISTNGWMAFGDHRNMFMARNRHMPGAENIPAMLAPFWDELITPNGSGIYTYYDDSLNVFIVEWSRVQRLVRVGGDQGAIETFQVILFDPVFHPNRTGDGDIVFQYNDVTEERICVQDHDTPYATVGIASPKTDDGLEYTYWHQLHPGADSLRDGWAIKFTTLVEFRTGVLFGQVTDAASGLPVEGASINCSYGFSTVTDEGGNWRIENVLVDTNYTVRASKRFYNTTIDTGIVVNENEETFVPQALLRPEFSIGADSSFHFGMLVDSTTQKPLSITNLGNGELTYTSRFVFEDAGNPWSVQRNWSLQDSLQDNQVNAVCFVKDHFVVACGNNGRGDTTNYFVTLNRQGVLDRLNDSTIIKHHQPVVKRNGIKDMEYLDGAIWAVYNDVNIIKIDTADYSLLGSWRIPAINNAKAMTVDPATKHFYISASAGDIFEFVFNDADSTFNSVRQFGVVDTRTNTNLVKYGLTWFRDDPNGYNLYVMTTNETPVDNNAADIAIFKVNVNTATARFVTSLPGVFAAGAMGQGGISITPKWNNHLWVMAAMINGGNGSTDRLAIIEIAPNSSWISYDNPAATLEPFGQGTINVSISTHGLDVGDYGAGIEFTTNAYPGRVVFPIDLSVLDSLPPPPPPDTDTVVVRDPNGIPYVFELKQNYPNPFNPTTTIRYGLDRSGSAKLYVYDVQGREVLRLVDGPMPAGRYSIAFDANALPAGLYIYRLESRNRVAVHKMVLVK